MRKRRRTSLSFGILAVVLLMGRAPSTPAQTPSPAPSIDPKVAALAKTLFLQSQSGTLDRSLLDPKTSAELTPAIVRDAAKDLGRLGRPTSFTFVASREFVTVTGTGYEFRATFAKAPPLNFFVGIEAGGKVIALLYSPYEPQAHLPEANLVAELRSKLQRAAADDRFSGAVLLAKDGKPIFEQAYGYADRVGNIPNSLATKFRIGSMNKMFTGVAVLQLVQAGRINLDDPLGKYLADYPNRDVANEVTIEQLLTHTGGTGDFFGPQFDAHRLQLRTLDDYVQLFGNRGPAFKPGSRFEYSNYGYILLGAVVQRVSGQSYYDYVRAHIYQPAGMNDTGSEPEDVAVPNRSIGYTTDKGEVVPNTDTLPYRGTSAGGGYSTVGDMLRFANALQGHVLLDAVHTAMLTTGTIRMPTLPDLDRRYAFGFGDQVQNGIRCFGHNGGAPGMSGSLEICPDTAYTVVALANVDPPAADNVTDFVINNMPLP
jgi:D-alanyl-D-alanine carboxypeptidase